MKAKLITELETLLSQKHTYRRLDRDSSQILSIAKSERYQPSLSGDVVIDYTAQLKVAVFVHRLTQMGFSKRYRSSGDSVSCYLTKKDNIDSSEIRISDHNHPNPEYYNGLEIKIRWNTTWYNFLREIAEGKIYGGFEF